MGLADMESEISEHTTHFLCDHVAGKIPVNGILYNILWAPVEERRARIISPAEKKIMVAAGIEPLTSR
jgi:hypothetical protein